jgi:hypothetical protein
MGKVKEKCNKERSWPGSYCVSAQFWTLIIIVRAASVEALIKCRPQKADLSKWYLKIHFVPQKITTLSHYVDKLINAVSGNNFLHRNVEKWRPRCWDPCSGDPELKFRFSENLFQHFNCFPQSLCTFWDGAISSATVSSFHFIQKSFCVNRFITSLLLH